MGGENLLPFAFRTATSLDLCIAEWEKELEGYVVGGRAVDKDRFIISI